MISILTRREREVIDKKLKGKKLSQQDSNYLSRYVRPKLKAIQKIDAKDLFDKLKYNQKAKSIERKIKKIILKNLKNVDSITLYGSVVQNNYKNYNDIDVLVVVKRKFWKKLGEKYKKILEIKNKANKEDINLDLAIYDKKAFQKSYIGNISLIYQLKDKKIIYGKFDLPRKIDLYNVDLQMKLDWSDIDDIRPRGVDIYNALRNVVLVSLLFNKIIDNKKLKDSLNKQIGENLIQKLKNNQESRIERKIALYYLRELSKQIREKLGGNLWEKIEL